MKSGIRIQFVSTHALILGNKCTFWYSLAAWVIVALRGSCACVELQEHVVDVPAGHPLGGEHELVVAPVRADRHHAVVLPEGADAPRAAGDVHLGETPLGGEVLWKEGGGLGDGAQRGLLVLATVLNRKYVNGSWNSGKN